MAVKIQFRRGNAAAAPNLDIGEPGYDIDAKVLRVGDGTTSPPRIPTTKSSGSFDFSTVTDFRIPRLILGLGSTTAVSMYFNASDQATGFWSPGAGQIGIASAGTTRFLLNSTGVTLTGDLTVTGTVDGVDISKLNPVGVNGILVKTGANAFSPRSLLNGVGIAPFKNTDGGANPAGVSGDIVVQIADNATIPGNAAMKVPAGTTGERVGVSAINGHFRYNSSKKSFEGFIDGEWREFVDYVEGKVVNVPSQFATIQDAVDYFNNRSTKSAVYIQLENGVQSVSASSGLTSGSRTNRIVIRGATPVEIPLDVSGTPVVSVSGAAGNWSVVLKLTQALPDWLTVGPSGHSIVISNIDATGNEPYGVWNGSQAVGIDQANLARINLNSAKDSAGAVIPISAYYAVNDYIMTGGLSSAVEIRRISAMTSTLVATVASAFLSYSTTAYMHRKFRAINGTLAATNSTTINGTGTAFTSQLNVGDHLILLGTMQVVRVKTIVNDTQFTTDFAVTIGGGTGYGGMANNVAVQHVPVQIHEGCWQVTAKNTVDRTITIVNTSRSSVPPPIKGIRRGSVTFLPSAVLFTGSRFFTVYDSEYLGLQNLTVRYTGANPTNTNYGILNQNGYVTLDGVVGFNNAPVYASRNATLAMSGFTAICASGSGAYALTLQYGSSLDFVNLVVNGSNGGGMYIFGSPMTGSRLNASGNNGHGLVSGGGSNISVSRMVHSYNRFNGLRVASQDRTSTGFIDLIGNGWASPVGPTQKSSIPNLVLSNASGFQASHPGTLVFSAADDNIYVYGVSSLHMRGALVAATPGCNMHIRANSTAIVNGSIFRNSENTQIYGTLGAHIQLRGEGESVDYGKGSGIHMEHNSFAFIHGGNTASAPVSALKRGALAPTTCWDALARFCSNIYVYKCKGSGASNALIASPALNAPAAFVGSNIYGEAA